MAEPPAPPVPPRPLQRIPFLLVLETPWAWPLDAGEALRGALGYALRRVDEAAFAALYSDPPSVSWRLRLPCTGHPAPVLGGEWVVFSDDGRLVEAVRRAGNGIRELALRRGRRRWRVVAAEALPLPAAERLDRLAHDLAERSARWRTLTPMLLTRGHEPLTAERLDVADILAAALRAGGATPGGPVDATVWGRGEMPDWAANTVFPYKGHELPALVWDVAAAQLPTDWRPVLAAAWATGAGRLARVGAGTLVALQAPEGDELEGDEPEAGGDD